MLCVNTLLMAEKWSGVLQDVKKNIYVHKFHFLIKALSATLYEHSLCDWIILKARCRATQPGCGGWGADVVETRGRRWLMVDDWQLWWLTCWAGEVVKAVMRAEKQGVWVGAWVRAWCRVSLNHKWGWDY